MFLATGKVQANSRNPQILGFPGMKKGPEIIRALAYGGGTVLKEPAASSLSKVRAIKRD
jgi:hypothetical protein